MGKLVLNVFDYYTLFQLAAVIMAVGIVPSILLRSYGWPAVQKDLEVQANSVELAKEMATHPTLAGVILYHAMTFGVVLAVYPVYVSDASLTNQDIKLMFFVFGMSRFVTLLLLVTRISKYGVPALALAVLTTAVGIHSTTLFLARGAWPAQQRPDLPQMCLAQGGLILRSLS